MEKTTIKIATLKKLTGEKFDGFSESEKSYGIPSGAVIVDVPTFTETFKTAVEYLTFADLRSNYRSYINKAEKEREKGEKADNAIISHAEKSAKNLKAAMLKLDYCKASANGLVTFAYDISGIDNLYQALAFAACGSKSFKTDTEEIDGLIKAIKACGQTDTDISGIKSTIIEFINNKFDFINHAELKNRTVTRLNNAQARSIVQYAQTELYKWNKRGITAQGAKTSAVYQQILLAVFGNVFNLIMPKQEKGGREYVWIA